MKWSPIAVLTFSLTVTGASHASRTHGESCANDLSRGRAYFESTIEYDDLMSKANPTVHVWINGRPAKMMFDTGANANILWDSGFFLQALGEDALDVDAHVASARAKKISAEVADGYGNAFHQDFYIPSTASILARDGYAGILSPQSIAGHSALLIDFEKNCFFTSAPFPIRASNELKIYPGKIIENPYREMAVQAKLGNVIVPFIIDSGAQNTMVLTSLVASAPEGKESPRAMDMYGAELPRSSPFRLIDLNVNGEYFHGLPVSSIKKIHSKGVSKAGYIGMDVLKNHLIYYHGPQHTLLTLRRLSVLNPMPLTDKTTAPET